MGRKMRKRLVIDASLLQAASADSDSPHAKDCFKVLDAVKRICHRAVVNAALESEWDKHWSLYAVIWRNEMVSKKKLDLLKTQLHPLRERLEEVFPDRRNRKAAEKDLHLIELALAADGIVLSLDDAAKRLFENATTNQQVLRRIAWHNPAKDAGATLRWLRGGARLDQVPE